MDFDEQNLAGVDVAELLVATADHSDETLPEAISQVLALVRARMGVDAVFVRAFRPGDRQGNGKLAGPARQDPLEAVWGEHLLLERLQHSDVAGAHMCSPVVLTDGSVYGTLCSFSQSEWTAQADRRILKSTARLIAQKIEPPRRDSVALQRWDQTSPMRRSVQFGSDATHP